MSSYRIYYMNADGHFTGILELSFSDDDAAIADAESRVEGHYAIEVFQEGRRVARIKSELSVEAVGARG